MNSGALANLGGVALLALPGLGLAELFPALSRLSFPRRIGYAYLLGVVAVGGTLFAASHLFGAPLHRPAIVAAAGVPAAWGLAARVVWRRRRSGGSPPRLVLTPARPTHRWRLLAALAVTGIGLICLGPLIAAVSTPLTDWDGRMTWTPLAAYLHHAGTVDAPVLQDVRWWVMHPRYPPLLPLAQVAVQETFGAGVDDQDFRALYVGILVALLLIIQDGARRAAGSVAAILATLCACLPPFLLYGEGGATSAYSDLALAGFYGGALVLLLLAQPGLSTWLAAGCLLAGAVLTKNEGTPLAVVALLLAAARLLRRLRRRDAGARAATPLGWLAAAAGPVLAAAALLASWRTAIPNRDDEDYFAGLHLGDLLRGAFTRLPVIVPEILRWTFRWSHWLGFWVIVFAVLIVGRRALRRPFVRRLLLAALAPAAIGWAAYAVSANLGDIVRETWPRFLLQGLAPSSIVFACALGQMLRRLSRRTEPRSVQPYGT